MSAHSCQEAKEDNASSTLCQIVPKGDTSPQRLGARGPALGCGERPRWCRKLQHFLVLFSAQAPRLAKNPPIPHFSPSRRPPFLPFSFSLSKTRLSSLFKAITEVFIVFKQEGETTVTKFGPCFSQHPFSRTVMCLALEHPG